MNESLAAQLVVTKVDHGKKLNMGSRTSTMQRVRTESTGHYGSGDSPQDTPTFDSPQQSGGNQQTFQIRPRSSSAITPAEWIRDRISFQLVVKCPICSKAVSKYSMCFPFSLNKILLFLHIG